MKNQINIFVKMGRPYSKLSTKEFHSLNRRVLEDMGIFTENSFDIIHEEFEKRRDHYVIYHDSKDTIEKIYHMGIKIGLLSNVDSIKAKTRRPVMRKNEILHFFDTIILSDEVGYVKPQKKIFDLALNAIGIQDGSKVIHVGDNLIADAMGAKNAGLIPILYDPHGFYKSDDNLIKIKALSEILNYLN
jgi:HAD superfamily hydrolase (TIGR01549 family)